MRFFIASIALVALMGCGGSTEDVLKGICNECSKFIFADLEGKCSPYFN